MNINYFKETDTLYIQISAEPIVESKAIGENLVVDIDSLNNVCAITLEHAGQKTNVDKYAVEGIAA